MARIRTIKPDAFTSESLSAVSVLARWTFIGLLTYLDDTGVGRADTRLVKSALYPLDDLTTVDDVDRALSELIDAGCIHTYQSGGKVYIHAPEFLRHQRVSHPSKSTLPHCSCMIPETLVSPPEGLRPEGKGREGKGIEGEGKRETPNPTTRPPRTCPKHPEGTDKPCRACGLAREAHEAWRKPTHSPQTKCGEHPKRAALNCPDCAAEAKANPETIKAIRELAGKKAP